MSAVITLKCYEVRLLRIGRILQLFLPGVAATTWGSLITYWLVPTKQERIHEFFHVGQAYRMIPSWAPKWAWVWAINPLWLWRYIRAWRKDGDNNVYELEARKAAGQD